MAKKTSRSSSATEQLDVPVLAKPKGRKKKVGAGQLKKDLDYNRLNGEVDNRDLLRVLTEVRNGNFAVRMPFDQVGLSGKICDTLNDIISINEKMMQEFTRAGNTIGKQGKLT